MDRSGSSSLAMFGPGRTARVAENRFGAKPSPTPGGERAPSGLSENKRGGAAANQDGLLVNLEHCKYECLRKVTAENGFEEVGDDEQYWDLCWMDSSVSEGRVAKLYPFQRINHFPGMLEICRKAPLSRNLRRMQTAHPREYSFSPQTWDYPAQLDLFRKYSRANPDAVYIVKPSAGAMGRGIYLASGESGIDKTHSGAVVVQRYMHDPFLLDGFKFDLRIYALVTCVDPLAVYVYDEGIARFATTPYAAPDKSNLSQVTMHLTNYSLNKHSATFMSTDKEDEGTKRSISSLFAQMKATGHDTEKLWRDIREVVARTVLPIQPHLAHCYHSSVNNAPRSASERESESERGANGRASGATPRGYADLHADDASPGSLGRSSPSAAGASADDEPKPSRCFELLGFDIIIDEKLRPWLIEVNHSPSFNMDSSLDARVKCGAIGDVLRALNLDGEERRAWIEAEKRAQKKRLYKTGETLRNARMGASANGVGGVGGYTDRAHPAGVGSSGSSGGGYGSTMGGYGSGYATMERPRSGWGRTRPKLPIPPAHSLDDDDDDSDEFSTVRTVAGYARAAPPPRRGGRRERAARAARSARSGCMDATEPPERLGGFTRVYPPAGLSPSERRNAEALDAKLLAHALSFFRPEPGCSCVSCDARKRTSGGGVAETSYSVQHTAARLERVSVAGDDAPLDDAHDEFLSSFPFSRANPNNLSLTSGRDGGGRRRFTDNLSVKSYADSYSRLAKKY